VENIIIEPDISMNHVGRIIEMISEIPYFKEKNSRVNKIENLPGGLTNHNFKVTVDGEMYAVRLAGEGTLEYLDREAEKHNAGLMSDMGINARIIYYDATTGNQVCEYIDGKTLHVEDFHDPQNLKRAAQIFHKYHNCGKEFLSEFDPIKITDGYNDLLMQKRAELFEGYGDAWKKVEEIKRIFEINPQKPGPSHNDPLPENYLVDHRGMWLIDWEYSGMTDPMFDLGDFSIEMSLNEEEERFFLEEYFGGTVTLGKYGLVVIHKFLCDVLWSAWAVLQIATGKPRDWYWNYGQNRFNRCMSLMHSEHFDEYLQAVKDNSEDVYSKRKVRAV
jgi:thiamine kinase-like enzyme